jgi:PAS domain S-box-containing protein
MAHILFVDDEPAIRETFPKILTLGGHTVVSAATVAEALGFITSEHFDLLISDLNIGHPADGFVVVSAMKRTHPECVTFILTGYPGFESALQAIREQVDEYLVKPADVRKILATIEEKLRKRKPREVVGYKRLSKMLRENIPLIIERTLQAMKQDPELAAWVVTDGERVEGLADALGEVAELLEAGGPLVLEVAAAEPHEIHPLDLMVQKQRVVGRVLSDVLYENLLSLDLSHLMPDMAHLHDAFLWQVAASVRGYVEAHLVKGGGKGVAERIVEMPGVDAQGVDSQSVELQSIDSKHKEVRPPLTSAEQFEAIIESAMDAIISVDANQQVVLFNRGAEQMFGCSAVEAMGKTLDRFLPQQFREAHREHVERFGGTGVTTRSMHSPAVLSAVRHNGKQFPVEATISQVGEGGQKRYTVILRDITHRKRTERALVHSEKMASLGRLSAAVAHEINNPLEALKNLIYLIANNPYNTEMVREYAELADVEVSHIAEITRQVLGMSRTGDMPTQFRVTEMMDMVLTLARRKIGEKSAALQKEYRQDGEVRGVASEIRQVFWNLLVNSIDAIALGGSIRVRVSGYRRPGEERKWIRVTFADNGEGIAAPDLARLFEPFFTTKASGNGLGLWVVKQIVDNHEGWIRVRSRCGGSQIGTVFSIFLPVEAGL